MSLNTTIPTTMIVPRVSDTDEDLIEAQEESSDLFRKCARESARQNKVTRFLKQDFWRVDKTWPSLYWKVGGWQSRVEMYFPKLNLAVDRFLRPTSMDRQEAAFKATALKSEGVNYVALFPETKLKELSKYA